MMRARTRRRFLTPAPTRRGVASAELAVVLSTLVTICLATSDFARSVYAVVTIANCARNGAMYACDATFAAGTPYSSLSQAALADANGLTSTPTVSSTTGTDGSGNSYVEVSVSYPFQTTVNYPGIPNSITFVRTVRMAVAPQ